MIMMIRIIAIILLIFISASSSALDQCTIYDKYVEIAKENGFKAYETPQEIYFSGAKCYRSKGQFDKANDMSFYAAIFGDQFAQVDYIWREFSNGINKNVLVTLSAMSVSPNANTAFNSKLLLGLYYSTSKDLPKIPHLTLGELRVYGIKLLEEASNSDYGFTALYALAAILKKSGNPDWIAKRALGDDKQKAFVGSIQRTCTNVVTELIGLYESDSSLISDKCE